MSPSFQRLTVLMVFFCAAVIGCGKSTNTVPVQGTLTIDGQPADNIMITLSPVDSSLPVATGRVSSGSFELFSGIDGARGAVPGKYKVVLAPGGSTAEEEAKARYMQGAKAGTSKAGSPPPESEATLPFATKYTSSATSDKEVEITSGSNNLTIDVSSS